LHNHQNDKNYENVVLHVVWNSDCEVKHSIGTLIPTIELKNKVSLDLYSKYENLVSCSTSVPCANHLSTVSNITKMSMLDRVFFQRLTNKNSLVFSFLSNNRGDWNETAYQLLAHNFGFGLNSLVFLNLAVSLPFKILVKCSTDLLQIESLLFGQSGLIDCESYLEAPFYEEEYLTELKKMYKYLSHKFELSPKIKQHQWKFFRLRPNNFPTIRIAQFAKIVSDISDIFDFLVNTPLKTFYKQMAVKPSKYWQNHYILGAKSKAFTTSLGRDAINGILINTVAPLLVAYGKVKDEQVYINRAVEMLQNIPAEQNKITRFWKSVGLNPMNAFNSQAFIELFNNFCSKKLCLSCSIGIEIMGNKNRVKI